MSTHSIADATARLPELIDRALQGEDVTITRDGHPVITLRPLEPPARPVSIASLDWLAANRVGLRQPSEDAGALVSRMRDEDWR